MNDCIHTRLHEQAQCGDCGSRGLLRVIGDVIRCEGCGDVPRTLTT